MRFKELLPGSYLMNRFNIQNQANEVLEVAPVVLPTIVLDRYDTNFHSATQAVTGTATLLTQPTGFTGILKDISITGTNLVSAGGAEFRITYNDGSYKTLWLISFAVGQVSNFTKSFNVDIPPGSTITMIISGSGAASTHTGIARVTQVVGAN